MGALDNLSLGGNCITGCLESYDTERSEIRHLINGRESFVSEAVNSQTGGLRGSYLGNLCIQKLALGLGSSGDFSLHQHN